MEDIELEKISEYIDENSKKGIPMTTKNKFKHILSIYSEHNFANTKHALY